MIYLLAANLEDARQWAFRNGLDRKDVVYVGQTWNYARVLHADRDRIARTDLCETHPGHAELERELRHILAKTGLEETGTGHLVVRG